VSDYFDDVFFSKFCDESIVNQYLKMLACSSQDFGSANIFSGLKIKIERQRREISKIEKGFENKLKEKNIKLEECLDRIRKQELLLRKQGVLISSLYGEIDKERSKVANLESVLSRKQRKLIYNSKKSC